MNHEEYFRKLSDSIDTLTDILDTAHHGMCVVDRNGIVVKWNYENFFNIKAADAIGRHVTEVIKNTRLHIVAKTGVKELMQLMEFKDEIIIANRIPLIYENETIGAAGTVLFRNIKELETLYTHMSRLENNFKAIQSEIAKMYSARYRFDDILTNNQKMISLKRLGMTIAKTDASVLIQGESGTGKELFAQAIHNASPVRNHPFISINCSSIPKELLESELFGYESGAFTGAHKNGHIGKFELAGEGTLFLDELGTTSPDMQVKFLRVLESKEFVRLGSTKKIPLKARIIAATNDNLSESIQNGRFRLDLYYRLNVINIELPPLRERSDDIPLLADNLIPEPDAIYANNKLKIDDSVYHVLEKHNWPGNIRELRNVIERAAFVCETDCIQIKHLPEYLQAYHQISSNTSHTGYYHAEIARLEKEMIEQALKEQHNNRQAAANQLGIHRSLLYKKMKDLGIS